MNIHNNLSDQAVLEEIGRRVAQRRIDLGLTQADAAREAGVAKRTLERLETGDSTQLVTMVRVLRVLDLLGALEGALPRAEPRPLDVVRRAGRRRRRASKARQPADEPWTWSDH